MRKRYSASFKTKIALEAIKGEKTVVEIASEYGIHPQQVRNWKPSDTDKLKKELEKNPDYVDLYYELAICYLHQAKFSWQTGIDYFKKALEINPELRKAKRAYALADEFLVKLNDLLYDIAEKNE